ncbi:peptidoglycan-binding protein [Limnochorda pilosa]|uniref:Peptidoglycan binding-like domain-containing protein n=1 Tax=Limnochorda pilosa TaxID=1555112 RepID=A0A0K2SQY1_LIMPI|nr:peptidoglycan-binding protein [Limnochorda pilosa]BAS29417.1 hypothetical protein LIP_3609 [Limnochorda pilosa]
MHPPWGHHRRVLALGARGQAVRTLQEDLARLGFDPGPMDGRYGLLTRQAVRECQRRYGLFPDGAAGPDLFHLLREPAVRLGGQHVVLGVVDPALPFSLERWARAYPFASAVVRPTRFDPLQPGQPRGAGAWAEELEQAGAGEAGVPPWAWRITRGPALETREAPETQPARTETGPAPAETRSAPGRRARRELVSAILRVVDRFHPIAVDVDLEPVLPGDGRRWLKLLAALREALSRRGVLLLATRDLARRPSIWPAWADDLPDGLLARNVDLLVLARRPLPGESPPSAAGAAALDPVFSRASRSPSYKVLVELPLGALQWTLGPDRPLEGPAVLSFRAARVEALKHARRLRWDDRWGALTFQVRHGSDEQQYWLPSARSVEQVLRRVARARLAGVVLAALGGEDPRAGRVLPGPLSPWHPGTRGSADIPPAVGA